MEREEANMLKKLKVKEFWSETSGIGTVEIILILVILIGLVILFRTKVQSVVKDALNKIGTDSDKVIK